MSEGEDDKCPDFLNFAQNIDLCVYLELYD